MQRKGRFTYRRLPPIIFGLIIVLLFAFLLRSPNQAVHHLVQRLDYIAYDLRFKTSLKQDVAKPPSIIIVDIDEKSLKQEGRWPWSRKKLATLLANLHEDRAAVVAFDIIFSEPERNVAGLVFKKLNAEGFAATDTDVFSKVDDAFNHDVQFAKQLAQGDNVLGYALHRRGTQSLGDLPAPIIIEKKTDDIHRVDSYTAPIAVLMNAAKLGGFLTTIPDRDGVLRRSPLLLRYENGIYPSLALEAIRQYLFIQKLQVERHDVGDYSAVEGIKLGEYMVPTDRHAQVLIPYRGRMGSFTNLSATDIINQNYDPKIINNSIVFVGTTALGLADLVATPLQSVFPGVEVHANIAAGLLEKSFAHVPAWADAVELLFIVAVGVLLSVLLPYLSAMAILIGTAIALFALVATNYWFWASAQLAIPIVLPVLLILALSIFNTTYGFLMERRKRRELHNMFDQYVPPEHIDEIMKHPGEEGFDGEARQMSVLFSDIRNFTTISEQMGVAELKQMLNIFFTKITGVIFEHNGTIDKYIGDLVMAFWGAPLKSETHARDSIGAALDMQLACRQLRADFAKHGYPELKIGVGINTGLMNVGDMGSEYRRNYTVLGDAVNLASRLESLSKYYHAGIIVSEQSQSSQVSYVFRQLDKIRVKGKDEAVVIFEPLCRVKDANPQMYAELKSHDEALQYYYQRDWRTASEAFTDLHKTYPQVFLYELYLDRIKKLQSMQLADDWDGVYSFKEK